MADRSLVSPANETSICNLVGGIPTPLTNMKVSWDDEIPNIWKVIKFHGSSHHQPECVPIFYHELR